MNNPELYSKSNALQIRDAKQILKEYVRKISWGGSERVVDIGCGDGLLTSTILKGVLPKDFEKLRGYDISSRMVDFANRRYQDERTSFSVLDIEGALPDHCSRTVDHAFSFYALHWIKKQDVAFTNIYEMLDYGGDCLLVFLGHMPIFDVFRVLAKQDKWKEYLKEVDQRFVSPYHDSQAPEKEVESIMTKTGFKNVTVERKEMTFVFDRLEVCKKAVAAVNPFKIPAELQDRFLEDYVQVMRDMRLVDQANNNADPFGDVTCNYSVIVASGAK